MRTRSLIGKKTLAGTRGSLGPEEDSFFPGYQCQRLVQGEAREQQGLKSTSFGSW